MTVPDIVTSYQALMFGMFSIMSIQNLLPAVFTALAVGHEVITLIALYLMMCLSDFVPEPEARSQAGLAFICTLCLYAAVHIYFLITSMCASIWHSLRKVYY